MSDPMDIDLMVDALDLIGRLNYPGQVAVVALMHRLLPPINRQLPPLNKCRELQAARIQAHIERVRAMSDAAYQRLAILLEVIDETQRRET